MRQALIPLLCALMLAGTVTHAVTTLPERGATHFFPKATHRPPLPVVLADARSQDPNRRLGAVNYLGYYRAEAAFEALMNALEHRDFLIRLAAMRGLLKRADDRAIEPLERLATGDPQDIVRHRAELYLEMLRNPLGR